MRSSLRALVALPALILATGCAVDTNDPDPATAEAEPKTGTVRSEIGFEPLLSSGQGGFAAGTQVLTGFCSGLATACTTADVNGDGRADFVSLTSLFMFPSGSRTSISVSLANSDGTWAAPRSFGAYSSMASAEVGDVNGDGRDDLVLFDRSTGNVSIMTSSGTAFAAPTPALTDFCRTGEVCKTGDFDGDGNVDVARFLMDTVSGSGAGDVFVARSTGTAFAAPTLWATSLGIAGDMIEVGDTNGDRKADVVQFRRRGGIDNPVFVSRSSGTSFGPAQSRYDNFCAPGMTCKVGNIDGGSRADLVAFVSSLREGAAAPDLRNDVYASLARVDLSPTGVAYGPARVRGDNFCPKDWTCMLADVDADGRDDLVAFSRNDSVAPGVVRVAKSTFGKRSTYVLDHTRMTALSTEGSSDKPLLINLNFRSRLGVRNSSVVTSTTYDEHWGTGLAVGEWRTVPSHVGETTFSGLSAPTLDEIASRRGQVDVVGSVVLAVEKDLSAADSWRAITEEAKRALTGILADTLEVTTPIDLALNPARFSERLSAVSNDAKNRIMPMLDELIGLYVSGLFDPDDIIGFHLYLYPAVDKEVASLLPPSPDPALVTLAPLGDGDGYWPETATFRGGPVHWRLESRPRFVSFAP